MGLGGGFHYSGDMDLMGGNLSVSVCGKGGEEVEGGQGKLGKEELCKDHHQLGIGAP